MDFNLDIAPGSRVVVAMSGGVDSSVAAALVRDGGYDTVGITLQLYDHGAAVAQKGSCCAGQDIHDARRVAGVLGIPHYVLNYESRFREAVIDDFADSYLAGQTPIPCVRCNQTVKFRDLLARARELGAAALLTGHYVRRVMADDGPAMLRGRDRGRDQSYFLFATTREQLGFLRFPLGSLDKAATRGLAEKYRLPVAAKPDSQDICFVPGGGYAAVIEKLRPEAAEAGDIVDLSGRVLGRHAGIIHYTIGQRRGIGIGGVAAPLYVVRLEAEERRVVVGPREALMRNTLLLHDINWLAPAPPAGVPLAVAVKLRSMRPPVAASVVAGDDGGVRVTLNKSAEGIAPGQACVFYDGERLLGGGWIAQTGLDQVALPITSAMK